MRHGQGSWAYVADVSVEGGDWGAWAGVWPLAGFLARLGADLGVFLAALADFLAGVARTAVRIFALVTVATFALGGFFVGRFRAACFFAVARRFSASFF